MRKIWIILFVFCILSSCTLYHREDAPSIGTVKQVCKKAVEEVLEDTKVKMEGHLSATYDNETNKIEGTIVSRGELQPPIIKLLNEAKSKEEVGEWLALFVFLELFFMNLLLIIFIVGIFGSFLTEFIGNMWFTKVRKMALSFIIGIILSVICGLTFVVDFSFALAVGLLAIVGSWLGWWAIFDKGLEKLVKNIAKKK